MIDKSKRQNEKKAKQQKKGNKRWLRMRHRVKKGLVR